MLLGVGALTKRLNTRSKAKRKTKNIKYQEQRGVARILLIWLLAAENQCGLAMGARSPMRVHLQRQATARGETKINKTGKVLCTFLSEEPSLLSNNAFRRWVLAGGRGAGV